MKRYSSHVWQLFVVMLLAAVGASAAPLTSTIRHEGNTIVIEVVTGGVALTEREGNILPEMGECEPYSTPGAPVLPVKTFTLALPPNAASVAVAVADLKTETVALPEGKRIQPGSPALSWDGTNTVEDWCGATGIVDGFSMPIYGADAYYPEGVATVGKCGQMRKWKTVTVSFNPVRYNPVARNLDVARSARLVVSYELEKAELPAEVMGDSAMDSMAARTFENFDAASAAWYPAGVSKSVAKSAATYDYVIITTDDILSKTQCLATLEQLHEGAHTVVTVTQTRTYDSLLADTWVSGGWGGGVGDTAAVNIRTWLQSHWASMGIKYVLLVGDPDPETGDVPMKKIYKRIDDLVMHKKPSDTFYGEMNGNWDLNGDGYYGTFGLDDLPGGLDEVLDLVVGRFPVYTGDASRIARLESIVAKTIAYSNEADINWRKSVLLPMEDLDSGTTGVVLAEKIRNSYAVPAGLSTFRIYKDPADGGDLSPVSYDNVLNEWKKGYGLVCWSTHGSDVHAGEVFINSRCPQLDDTKPAFVFSMSCNNGWPENVNNLGVSLLRNGAIGVVSASRNLQYQPGSLFLKAPSAPSMSHHFAKRIIAGETAGDALFLAREDSGMRVQIEYSYSHSAWTSWLALNLYGDPAVSLYDSGSGNPAILVNPNPINMYAAFAHSQADASIRVFPSGPGTLPYTVTDNADWLTVSPDSGTTFGEMDTLALHANTASLTMGLHSATITVTAPGAANSPLFVPVRLTISEADADPPSIACSVSSLNYTIAVGENISREDFEVSAAGEGLLNVSISQGAAPVPWLSVSPDSGTAYGTRVVGSSVFFNTAGLSSGTHTATIVITGAQTPAPPNSPLVIPVVVTVTPPLAEALDAPDFEWTTGETQPWIGTFATSHDGVDSAAPSVSTSGGSIMSTTVQGPGTVRFWWMTKSFPTSGNFLQFRIDGANAKVLFSSTAWTEVTKEIPEGVHKLEWVYAGVRNSVTYALLDQFSFTPTSGPYMAANPKRIVVNAKPGVASTVVPLTVWNAGGTGTFNLTASESGSELSLANATATVGPEGHTVDVVFDTTGLASGTSRTGNITLSGVGAANPSLSVPYKLTVSNNAVSLPEALDAPELVWSPGPGSGTMWEGTTESTHDGVDAGLLSLEGTPGSLKTTVQGPGHLSFAWKNVSGSVEAAYTFAVDGKVTLGPLPRNGGYQVEQVELLPGSHELLWAGTDPTGVGPDFYLDQVAYEQYVPEIALSMTEITATCQPGHNPVSQTFEIWNAGTGPMDYQFSEDCSWLTVLPGSGTSEGEHDTVTVSFLANRLGMGAHTAEITVSTIGVAGGVGGLEATISVTLEVGTKNVLSLGAATDNTLYQDAAGAKSNGAGPTIIVGNYLVTEQRRGLLYFDVHGDLPSQALITDAKLEMTVLGVESTTALPVSLRRVTKAWGEGTSNAAIPDDLTGAASTTGGATWIHAQFKSSTWTTAGGDYSATSSATKNVGRTGACVWGATPQLLADVQSWYTTPGGNYGWLLLPSASTAGWKRFASSEYATATERPKLTVTFYTSAPATALVPDVVGKSQANALGAITDAGLVVGEVAEAQSETVPVGMIIDQYPAGDTSVLLGSLVDVTVSTGPAPVIVPDMRGMDTDEVLSALAAAGLTEGRKLDTPSFYEVGLLAKQVPAAGTEVPRNSEIDLYYSTGAGLVDVPDLVGVAEPNLKQLLADSWLSEGARTYENSDKVAPGLVISQNPLPGTKVMTNTEIAAVVSIGPRLVRVPDVWWATEAEAASKLTGELLVKGAVSTSVSFSVPAGRVVSQDPAAETMVPEGSAVNIVLSVAPDSVKVPDVVGLTQVDAEDLLGAALLVRGTLTYEYSDTVAAGVVISQNPAAAATATPGSAVALVISSGLRPITGSILINNNRSATNNPVVTLALTWGGGAGTGVVRMRLSDDGSTWTAWSSLQATLSHTLLAGADGHRTVRVQYIDKLNNKSAVFSDYIRLDTIKPTGTIIINGGAATTSRQAVTLGLTWADAGALVSRMRFSDDGAHWTAWMPPTATRAHTLPSPLPGNQTVRVQYLDGAGNYSLVYNDYIKLVLP